MEELFQIPNSQRSSESTQKASRVPQPKSRRWIFWTVLSVVILVVAATLFGTGRFLAGAGAAAEQFGKAQDDLLAFQFEDAQQDIMETQQSIRQAQSGLLWLSWVRLLPWVGQQVEALALTLNVAAESLSALEQAVEIMQNVYQVVEEAQDRMNFDDIDHDFTFADFDDETRVELFRALHDSTPELQQMEVKLALAMEGLDELEELPVQENIQALAEPFRQILPMLQTGIHLLTPVAASLDELAGLDENRQWLILFLNDNELRPGGGFIGVYGLLLMKDGEIQTLQIDDSYAVDVLVEDVEDYQIDPPAAIASYIGVDKWYFRDSNWSPDIPTASSDARALLRQEFSAAGEPVPEVDGVISLTLGFAASLLDVFGPVTVDGIEFTADNLSVALQEDVEFGYQGRDIPWTERKAIIGRLADEILARVYTLPLDSWPSLIAEIQEGFATRSLAVFSEDEATQEIFSDAGWAASFDPETDDVLMLVDANMAALKTDPYIARDVTYAISKAAEGYVADVVITYKHTGTFSELVTRYRNYARIYVPLGSELMDWSGALVNDPILDPSRSEGDVTVTDDLGFTSFGAFLSVEPGEEHTLSFTYRLPENVTEAIDNGFYELWVEKQMGMNPYTLTLDLEFDKKIRAADPAENEEAFGDSAYTLNTYFDRSTGFAVEF